MAQFEGKRVLVTGGGSGIGLAVAAAFLREGARVAISGRDQDKLRPAAGALGICLAAEEKDSGVRVSVIYPGEVETPILEVRPQPVTAEQRRVILQPEDVAAAVLFVAGLPPRASVPELVIKPTAHFFV